MANRGRHSSNNFFASVPQPRYTHYGRGNWHQQTHNYYRDMNVPQHDYGQTSGYQQRPYPPQYNTQRNQNHNHSVREKTFPKEEDYKFYICPGCSHHFDFTTRGSRFLGRVPFILTCGHTLCQECIQKGAVDDNIMCPVCGKQSEFPNEKFDEVFSPNFYILGVILWSKPQGNQIMFVEAQTTSKNKKIVPGEQSADAPEPEGEKCGFLSCHKRAVLRCRDCDDVFCVGCCTMVHKNVKSMWSHVQVQITNGNFSAELEKCPEHGAMDVEFYCNTCEVGACCYCFIERHEGHEKEYLSKLNKEELNEFHIYKEKAEEVLKQLIISKRKLKNVYKGGTVVTEKKITSYFTHVHGELHLIHKRLLKELSRSQEAGKSDGVPALVSDLDSSIKIWRNVLAEAENMNVKKLNLRAILQRLREVEQTPCYLLCEASNDSSYTEFCPAPILDNLDDLFEIRAFSNHNLQLVSKSDLPPDYVRDPADSQYEYDLHASNNSSYSRPSKKEEANSYNKKISTQSHSSTSKTRQLMQGRRKKIDKKIYKEIGNYLQIPLDNEMVEVTHIESLECFYVQLKKHQSVLGQMNKDIENYVKVGADKVEAPEINELYLAMYVTKTERIWCRGRVTDVKGQGADASYEVRFIDFGSTQTLDINKLREITPQIAQRKAFAIQCELYNPTYASWGKNAHVYMGKIINGKELYMVVKNVNNNVYQVDLLVSSSDRDLTSIIDILIHTCSNALSSSSDSLNSVQRKSVYLPELKIYGNSFKFQKNQSERVMLANVIDPHNIFVHIVRYVELLRSMISDLKHHYKNKMSDTFVPIEGSYVVVEHRDPVRGNWHRALVRKVDMLNRNVHALLVDWGTVVVLPWSNLRILTENFTRMECQAILVKLAHVEPYQSAKVWSEKATFFLQKNFRTQDSLKMTVHCVDPLEVALFEMSGSVNICINAQLVREKFADSTGKISQTLEWPKEDHERSSFSDEEGFVESLLKKVDETSDEDTQDDQDEAEAYVKQQISIVKIVGPDLIYIKFLHLEQQEGDMYKELQIHYSKDKRTKNEWKENEGCAAQLPDCYVRGRILRQEGDRYIVNLYDRAEEVSLPMQKLFIYSDYFKKYPIFVYKCHLANIRPAGGTSWSLSSIEALEKTFDKHKDVFATKIPGDPVKKSIPMLMWYTRTRILEALEPSITKFVSINKLLVKLGFAYRETHAASKGDRATSDEEDAKSGRSGNEMRELAMGHKTDELDESVESTISEREETKEKSSLTSLGKANTASTSSDWNELIEEEQNLSESKQDSPYHTRDTEITDWKPAFPIEKCEFNAWITCAEPDGILYLRDEHLQSVYKEMELNMKQYFDNQTHSAEKKVWRPGQICTISYKDYWYRGKILKVNSPNEIIAVMIDFGSDHTLSPEQLHREILYPDIPAFASKVKLNRIYTKTDEWLSSDYDTLLDVVTEFAKVEIKGSLDIEIPLAEVYDDKGQSVNELLVKLCANLSRFPMKETEISDDELALVDEEDILNVEDVIGNQIDTTSMKFKIEDLPEDVLGNKILMYIVAVLACDKVVLKKIEENYEGLNFLNRDIQESCSTQPHLEDVEVGMPCICPYAEDGMWYRASVHNIDGIECGYVFVFFVDFGNVESVSIENIKMMKPKWFDVPVSSYMANINIELKMEVHMEHVLQHMKKLFTKSKLVHFVSKEPLVVDLYENNGELCYQSLIDKGLIKRK